jgi:hypothetical protein
MIEARRAGRWAVALATTAAALAQPKPAGAWLLHEHTHIGRTALTMLPAEAVRPGREPIEPVVEVQQGCVGTLEEAWAVLVEEEKSTLAPIPGMPIRRARLCEAFHLPESKWLFGKPDAAEEERCIDFPMLAAIAADFSCSPRELWRVATQDAWLPDILKVSQETEKLLAKATSNAARVDAWHKDHVQNFAFDLHYLERAKDNLGHFSWPRATDQLDAYLADALTPGRPPSSHASYVLYHASALRLVHASRTLTDDRRRRAAIRDAMLSEAFALHYLEDSFSAGHIAGRSGGSRSRAGTHDYYCENGLEGALWPEGRDDLCPAGLPGAPRPPCDKNTYLAHGDAFLEEADRVHAAHAVQRSLRDLAYALRWGTADRTWLLSDSLRSLDDVASSAMNACTGVQSVPQHLQRGAGDTDIRYTLRVTIQPARSTEGGDLVDGEPNTTLPTFASEMGLFAGVFASARLAGGAAVRDPSSSWQVLTKMDAGLEAGVGISGITTAQSDGLLWLQLGAALDSPAVLGESPSPHPGRFGAAVRVRAPFWVVPLLEHVFFTLPAWFLSNLEARRLLARGTESGLFGLARAQTNSLGSFQLVLGREFGFRYVVGPDGASRSFGFDWPVFEYKPRQWYAGSVSNVFSVQLGAHLDVDNGTGSILGAFLRVGTSARRYSYP